MLTGNFYITGAYDECLELDGKTEYCLVSTHIPLSIFQFFPVNVGMCLPKECTPEDITYLVNLIPGISVAIPSPLAPDPITCQSFKSPPYHWTAILMIFVCCAIGSLVILSTFADLLLRLWKDGTIAKYLFIPQTKQRAGSDISDETPLLASEAPKKLKKFDPVEWIQAFSLYKTIPTVLSTKKTSAAITCLNGMRVLSILWVILCHTHIWVFLDGADNMLEGLNVLKRFSFQAIGNGFFSVDSFFFMSGVLVAYLTFRQMKRRNGRFPYVMYYVHRYLRLTPVYAFVLFFTWFLIMHLGDGPNYKAQWIGGVAWNNCEKYWWTNFLYINNLYPWKLGDECIGWSWYLANDMQFFVISPLIIIPMYFLFPLGAAIAGIFLFVSFSITAGLTAGFDFQASTFAAFAYQYVPPDNITLSSQDLLYIKPYHRIQPYLVGLVLGYLLYKKVRIPFNRFIQLGCYLVMWALAFIFCFSTVYGLYNTWHGHIPSLVENIFYNTFSRFTWAVGLALLVFICHNGYGGWVNTFLSMSFWIPLSRLAFNAYLVHPVVLTVIYGSARKPVHYMDLEMAVYAVAVATISFAVAFLVTIFVEFPFGNLEIAFFKLFGVGNRESTRADTEAHKEPGVEPGSPLRVPTKSYSTNNGEKAKLYNQ